MRSMKKIHRITAVILAAVNVTVFSFADITFAQETNRQTEAVQSAEAQQEQYKESGRESVKKLSMEELKQLYKAIPEYEKLYKTEPVLTGSGYRPSVLSDEAYAAAQDWINYYRTVAGLGKITLDSPVNESASYGALVMAMNNGLNHFPRQPENMSDEDYQKARQATASSNISLTYSNTDTDIVQRVISGQIEDNGMGNIKTLGHRRWLLYPNAKTFGIGSANNESSYYTDVRVFGWGTQREDVDDYEFIAWPSSGANLSDTFSVSTPWSVTLNPDLYYLPVIDGNGRYKNVSVEVQSLRYGTTWTFNEDTAATGWEDEDFFESSFGDYGVDNCIIFRPAYQNLGTFKGDYIVTIRNLRKRADGEYTDIRYKVTFDDYAGTTPISDCDISLSQDSYVYDGEEKKPDVAVKDPYAGKELVKDTDYTLDYYVNTQAGIAFVYVKGINQYTGTKRLTFKIEQAQPQFSATIDKTDIDIDGYGIITVSTNAESWECTSDNPSVATVSRYGFIRGISEGTANITVKLTDENYLPEEKTFQVTVRQHVYDKEWVEGDDGGLYWYENGEKQGVRYLADGSIDTSYRGKEIYDSSSDGWYWLDGAEGGRRAESKDVYQESKSGIWGDCKVYTQDGDLDLEKTTGKWVRYNINGRMVKGWDYENGKWFYFDSVYGTMAKGYATIEGTEYYFDADTGVRASLGANSIGKDYTGWYTIGDNAYWFEHSIRQGYSTDSSYRGKEIYDPESDAWYWLDNVDDGKKAVSKDVYQESVADDDGNIGKWVRYDAQGHMIKGWQTTENGTYYFNPVYGTMYKGGHEIDGVWYEFDENTGVLK